MASTVMATKLLEEHTTLIYTNGVPQHIWQFYTGILTFIMAFKLASTRPPVRGTTFLEQLNDTKESFRHPQYYIGDNYGSRSHQYTL